MYVEKKNVIKFNVLGLKNNTSTINTNIVCNLPDIGHKNFSIHPQTHSGSTISDRRK